MVVEPQSRLRHSRNGHSPLERQFHYSTHLKIYLLPDVPLYDYVDFSNMGRLDALKYYTHPSRNEHSVPKYHFDLASSTKLSTHHSSVPT